MKTKNNKPAARSAHNPAKRSQATSKRPTRADLQNAYELGFLAGVEAAERGKGVRYESVAARQGFSRGHKEGTRTLRLKEKVDRYRRNQGRGNR